MAISSSNNSNSKRSSLVLATAEQVLRPAFSAWVTRLQAAHKLHHIALNDAHLMLTSPTLQQQLLQLQRLCAIGVPWSIVSATLLPDVLLDLA